MNQDVIAIDTLQSVVGAMVVPGITQVYFDAGRVIQILNNLSEKDASRTYKNKKYPLIAVLTPIRERRGSGHYCTAIVERIVIATLSKENSSVLERYQTAESYKNILYPCYYEFFKRLSYSPHVIGSDPDAFEHTKMDNPGEQPIGQGLSDYIDSIEILNLEIIFTQIKTC